MSWYAIGVAVGDGIAKGVEMPLQLAGGVRIDTIPDWVKNESALKLLSWHDRQQITSAHFGFAMEYEAKALGSRDPAWSGKESRSIQSSVDEKFALAAVALWCMRGSLVSCGSILHFGEKGRSDSLRTSGTMRPILVNNDEVKNKLTKGEVDLARDLHEAMLSLPRDKTRWIAVRMLLPALTERLWEIRFLLLWVVLEALFGPDEPYETTFRIAQRIALFLSDRGEQGLRVLREVKQAYRWRSRVVHGARLHSLKDAESEDLVRRVEIYIRATLQKLLLVPELGTVFDGKGREPYLESLAFGAPTLPAGNAC
jgi:hypothetical protein